METADQRSAEADALTAERARQRLKYAEGTAQRRNSAEQEALVLALAKEQAITDGEAGVLAAAVAAAAARCHTHPHHVVRVSVASAASVRGSTCCTQRSSCVGRVCEHPTWRRSAQSPPVGRPERLERSEG